MEQLDASRLGGVVRGMDWKENRFHGRGIRQPRTHCSQTTAEPCSPIRKFRASSIWTAQYTPFKLLNACVIWRLKSMRHLDHLSDL